MFCVCVCVCVCLCVEDIRAVNGDMGHLSFGSSFTHIYFCTQKAYHHEAFAVQRLFMSIVMGKRRTIIFAAH